MAAGLSREFVGGCSAGNPRLSQRGSRFPRRIIRACKLCILAYSLPRTRSQLFISHLNRLSKKLPSLLSSIRRIVQTRGHSCALPHGQAAVGSRLNSVGPLLHAGAHPPNERE